MNTIVLYADSSSGSAGADAAPNPAPATPAQPATGAIHSPPPAPSLLSPFRSHLGGPTEILILLVVVGFLAAILFGWALIFRKPAHNRLGRRSGVLYDGESRSSSGGKRRRRSRHPENRPRNPTLKERGGLPPMRQEDPPDTNSGAPDAKS